MVNVLLAILLGTMLSGLWFGIRILFELLAKATKNNIISRFSTVLAAIVPTIIISKYSSLYMWNVKSIIDWKSWCIVVVTVLLTAIIVSMKKPSKLPKGKVLVWYAVDGVMMEVPQRMMMQSFVCVLFEMWDVDVIYSVFVTAIVWCISICIQHVIVREKFDKNLCIELLSSFVFSVGIGIVLVRTELILFTMVAHFMERLASTWIRRKREDVE